jgi:phosphatidylglycerol:prolipoprotein diacylglycerol transferase
VLSTLQVGEWHVATYWVAVALAVTMGGSYAFHRLLRLDHPPRLIMQGMLLTVLGGFIGAGVITYLINTWLIARSGIFAHLEGMSIAWGIIGGAAVAAVYCRWHGASLGRALDLGVVPIPLGQAIGRLGCLAAGCCCGRATDSWLGMVLPDDNGVWMVRYPTQLMSAAANLVIFFILLAVDRYAVRRVGPHRSWPFNGFLALLYLVLFCLKRLAISTLRVAGSAEVVGPFSFMELSALGGLLVAGALLLWNLQRTTREEKHATAGHIIA